MEGIVKAFVHFLRCPSCQPPPPAVRASYHRLYRFRRSVGSDLTTVKLGADPLEEDNPHPCRRRHRPAQRLKLSSIL
jgi:hypothetical protein